MRAAHAAHVRHKAQHSTDAGSPGLYLSVWPPTWPGDKRANLCTQWLHSAYQLQQTNSRQHQLPYSPPRPPLQHTPVRHIYKVKARCPLPTCAAESIVELIIGMVSLVMLMPASSSNR